MAARWGHPKQRAQAPMQLRQSSELTRAPHHEGSSPLAAKELSTAYTMPRVAPTMSDPGPGASVTAGQAMRQGVTLHR